MALGVKIVYSLFMFQVGRAALPSDQRVKVYEVPGAKDTGAQRPGSRGKHSPLHDDCHKVCLHRVSRAVFFFIILYQPLCVCMLKSKKNALFLVFQTKSGYFSLSLVKDTIVYICVYMCVCVCE